MYLWFILPFMYIYWLFTLHQWYSRQYSEHLARHRADHFNVGHFIVIYHIWLKCLSGWSHILLHSPNWCKTNCFQCIFPSICLCYFSNCLFITRVILNFTTPPFLRFICSIRLSSLILVFIDLNIWSFKLSAEAALPRIVLYFLLVYSINP